MRNIVYFLLWVGATVFFIEAHPLSAQCPNSGNTTTSATFCSGTITLPNTNPDTSAPVAASPYPATVSVAGMSGSLSGLTLTIKGWTFSNSYPYSLQMMIVAPNNSTALVFFGGDCGANAFSFTDTITLSDSATSNPPNSISSACANNSTYRPYVNQNYTGDACPTFPGATPSSASCADGTGNTQTFAKKFGGLSPNGTWSIYANIQDDSENAGSISSIELSFTTEVSTASTTTAISSSAGQAFTTSPSNELTYTATVTSSGSAVTKGSVQFYDNGAAIGSAMAVNSSGQAQYTETFSSSTPEGSHSIEAVYTDTVDSSFGTSNNTTSVFVDNHTTGTSPSFCDAGSISFTSQGVTTPYPQHVFVSGLSGSPAGMTLTLKNITSSYGLSDWKILLVAPDGKAFVPAANAGGYAAPNGLATLNLSDAGTGYLNSSSSNTTPSASATYLPTDYSPAYTFPSPAPQSGYGVPYSLGSATFIGTFGSENLNASTQSGQEWSLYISDTDGDTGTVAGGSCLNFVTNNNTPTTTALNASQNPATTNTAVTLSAHVTANGTTNVVGGTVKFTETGVATPLGTATTNSSGIATISFTPTSEGIYNFTASYEGAASQYNPSSGTLQLEADNQTQVSGTSYCNTGTVTIASTSSTPQQYPSRILVSNLAGTISSMSVTVDGVTYTNPHDLAMMLEAPTGANLIFWANAGETNGSASISNENFVFEDSATQSLPQPPLSSNGNAENHLYAGTYLATAYNDVSYTFASPAPTPANANIASPTGTGTFTNQFSGINPNGYWSFFIMDDTAGGSSGTIGERCINLTQTKPVTTLALSHTPISFTQGDTSDTYNIAVTNNGPGPTDSTLTLTDTLPNGITAVSMAGTSVGTGWTCSVGSLTCTRSTGLASGTSDPIALTVRVEYTAPTGTNIVSNMATLSGGGASSVSKSDPTTILAGPATTTIALQASSSYILVGQSVALTATVASGVAGTPTGTVTFANSGVTLGSGTVSGGTATYTTSALPSGPDSLTATYSGDINYAGSMSSTVTVTVSPQDVWIVNNNDTLSELSNSGSPISSSSGYPGGGFGIAIDNAGDVWSASASALTKFTNLGGTVGTFTGGGISSPTSIAISGTGAVWLVNSNNSLSVFTNAGTAVSPSTGYTSSTLSSPSALAIDNAGNVWVANAGNNTVSEIIGAAAPVVTPTATAVKTNTLGTQP